MKEIICTLCPRGCHMQVEEADGVVSVSGNSCPRGEKYARQELLAPARTVTGTVKVVGGQPPRCPVKTNEAIPKEKIFALMEIIHSLEVELPINEGDVLAENVLNLGINIIATKGVK